MMVHHSYSSGSVLLAAQRMMGRHANPTARQNAKNARSLSGETRSATAATKAEKTIRSRSRWSSMRGSLAPVAETVNDGLRIKTPLLPSQRTS